MEEVDAEIYALVQRVMKEADEKLETYDGMVELGWFALGIEPRGLPVAVENFTKAIKLKPDYFEAYEGLFEAYMKLDMEIPARLTVEAMRTKLHSDPWIYDLKCAQIAERWDTPEIAEYFYSAACKYEEPEPFLGRCQFYLHHHELRKGLNDYKHYLRHLKENGEEPDPEAIQACKAFEASLGPEELRDINLN